MSECYSLRNVSRQREELASVPRDDGAHHLSRNSPSRCEAGHGVDDPGRLVSLPAVGYGSEVWRIRFGENAIFRNKLQQRLISPLPERYDAGKRDVPAGFDRRVGQLVRAGVAVQHSHDSRGSCLSDHRSRIVFRIPRMDDHRLSRFTRQRELLGEGAPLLGARGVVIVIIEAAFAYRDRTVSNEFAE